MARWVERLGGWMLFGRKAYEEDLRAFIEVYGQGRVSSSGKTVTWQNALEVNTILACARVLMNGVSQVPWRVYREDGGSKKPATDHPLYGLLNRRPNKWQTSFDFRQTLMLHLVMTNNAFVFINRVGTARRIVELLPIEPGRVEVRQLADWSLEYRVTGRDGSVQVFGADAIWHLRGLSWNGWVGIDAMKLARNSIGLAMSIEDEQAKFHENGAKTSGILSVANSLTPEKYAFLSAWLDKHLPGGERYQKPLIVDQGGSYTSTTMTGVDAQRIETRRFQVEQMCSGMGVMPIMIGAVATPTYASAEQMFQAHTVHAIGPYYVLIEMSGDVNLLSEEDRAAGYYTKFQPNALMRGVAKDRAEYYAKGLGAGGSKGWLTQNDVRDWEELDRIDDPKADELPQQSGVAKSQDNRTVEKDPADA